MNAIHNERVKLAASALSNTGVAITITGVVTPVANFLYGSGPLSLALYKVAPGLFLLGVALHILPQLVLGRLEDV